MFPINRYCGIEISSVKDESIQGALCFLQKQKGKLVIEDIGLFEGTIEELASTLKGNNVVCVYNTPSVLRKTIQNGQNLSTEEQFQQILPTEQNHYFYIQQEKGVDYTSHISIVRKKEFDDLIQRFGNANIDCFQFFLGSNTFSSIFPLLSVDEIATTYHTHSIKNNLIESFQPKQKDISLELLNETIQPKEVLSLAGALFALFPNDQMNPIVFDDQEQRISEIIYKKRTNQLIKYGGVGLFILLLFNFLLFTNQQVKNQQLTEEETMFHKKTELLTTYQEKVNEQQKLFINNPWLLHSRASFIIDRLMSLKPRSVLLHEINLFPQIHQDELKFNDRLCTVKGNIDNPLELNGWIQQLKQFDWVKRIEVTKFQESRKKKGYFELKIELK